MSASLALPLNDVTLAPRGRLKPVRAFCAGASLFCEMDPAPYLFEIMTGTVRLTRLLETGRRQVIAFAHPGDVVGFPDGACHHSDCEAVVDVTVLAHRASLLNDPNADPDTHRRLQSAALREIHTLQDHLLLMASKGALGKVASFLMVMAKNHGRTVGNRTEFHLLMPRADIADYLCISVETVSRMLTSMRQSGVIRLEGSQRVVVLDHIGLASMAYCE